METSFLAEGFKWLAESVMAHPWWIFAALCLLPAVGFPMSPLLVVAGMSFVPLWGVGAALGITSVALLINLTLSYLVAAGPGAPLVATLFRKMGRELPVLDDREAWRVILAVRLAPGFPYVLQNFALGCLRCHFPLYLVISMLVSGSSCLIIMVGGGALLKGNYFLLIKLVFLIVALLLLRRYLAKRKCPGREAGAID